MAYILNFSGGKDSTALLLMILERGLPLDYIINVDTTKEFPQMYEHIEKVRKYTGREIITVTFDYDYLFRDKEIKRRDGKPQTGYGWPTGVSRWCTGYKTYSIGKKVKELLPDEKTVYRYVGLAADETKRLKRNKNKNLLYPLAKWNITEAQALQYCYSKGFDWGGFMSIFLGYPVFAVR